MFENMTYENILADMLSRVISDVDKREGSIIYDALAPCAYQLAQAYYNLNNFIDLVFGDTAVEEYLDRVVADYGISRKQATKAIRKVEATGAVSIGTRWAIEGVVYVIRDIISGNTYKAECEQYGTIGNIYNGTLENLDNVSGVGAVLTDTILSGTDTETDDNLRARFYTQIQTPSTSGNVDNYIIWALEVPGVGYAKVFPLWNGPGTVKVLIVDSNTEIDESLEQPVHEYIEIARPIGALVTIDSPTGKDINVSADIVLDGSKTLEEIKVIFKNSLTGYLKDSVFESYSISYARIGSILLSTEGVRDYSNLMVNDGTANIVIGETEIPVTGITTLSEVV